jgi:Ser/Thr protein kinase RdoA (MazF antagonist)
LFSYECFRFTLFPSRGGRHPELDCDEHLEWLGRYIGRIHAVGALRPFAERPKIDVESFGEDSYQYVLEQGFVPHELEQAYRSVAEDVLVKVRHYFEQASAVKQIRLHGDCHMGNVLWADEGPLFLDLDDCRSGPAIQDLWMLLSGDRRSMERQLDILLEGYNQFYDFDPRELLLIEPLRTLRLLHYSAWLARRWNDPAFPSAFTWFDTPRYWEEQILTLKEQMAVLDEPVLSLY